MEAAHQVDRTSTRRPGKVGVKVGIYDVSICLETFLAGVRNFAMFFNWTKKDELFHLHASL